jgi:hypothetical protein
MKQRGRDMELEFEGNTITFEKELSKLDKLALDFAKCLKDSKIENVFLSGYVAILFGRNRSSEDVDCICMPVSFDRFAEFWGGVQDDFECIITKDMENGFNEYLKKGTALRFSRKGKFIPNVEMKFATTDMHFKAIYNSLEVIVNERKLNIAPFEQQIAYKLFMGSEKDIEDARFLFKLFEEHLDTAKLITYFEALEVPKGKINEYLGWSY